ncbi:DUF4381 domain-containing protein [Dinoroseobacter sp. PD6]|uniref:DUF4381 domain-containing protein n=1 Tax=Dinoroseobacter sp. PD6 TaxID=3028384 RepID=UPI00237ABA25|nr:DUF4381 domain-containing protein [Dinoroseobacter sp. PD6]MDD9716708.1 DUF4381 domain-containing protein [Dinoroseobacter sp. PD6]
MNDTLDTQNLVDLFDALTPIAEPAPISLAPQTAGWWVLGAALLTALAFAVVAWRRHRRATAYRRAALKALADAGEDPVQIAALLRRTALAAFPRAEVAGLHGPDWLAFLDRTAPGTGFAASPEGTALTQAPYRQAPPAKRLATKARHWITRHEGAQP